MTTEPTPTEQRAERTLRRLADADPRPTFSALRFDLSPQQLAAQDSAAELRRWAGALEVMTDAAPALRRALLPLLGRRPYLFERNAARWPDGLHLLASLLRRIARHIEG